MNLGAQTFQLNCTMCAKHPNQPVLYICLNSQYKLADVWLCRVCIQQKNRQKDTVLELKNIRNFIQRSIQTKDPKLQQAGWDEITPQDLKRDLQCQLQLQQKSLVQTILKLFSSDRKWLSEMTAKMQKDVQSERQRRKIQTSKLQSLNYLKNFTPDMVMMKLTMGSNSEILAFRNKIMDIQKLTEADIRWAKQQTKIRLETANKIKDKKSNFATEKLKEALQEQPRQALTQRVNVHRRSESSRERSNSSRQRKPIFQKKPSAIQ